MIMTNKNEVLLCKLFGHKWLECCKYSHSCKYKECTRCGKKEEEAER